MGRLERLCIGGDIEWPDRRRRQTANFAPGEELDARADISAAPAQQWLTAAAISAGPLFRKVNRGGAVEIARLVKATACPTKKSWDIRVIAA
jgi:hypothetical protein